MSPLRAHMLFRSGVALATAGLLASCNRDQATLSDRSDVTVAASTAERVQATPLAAPPEAGFAVAGAPVAAKVAAGVNESAPDAAPFPNESDERATAMLIRTGDASVEVDSLAIAISRVRALAGRAGGIVADVSVEGGRDQVPSARLELRVPADHFDEVLDGLKPLGKVESVNVHAEDVGEEFVDVTARVENSRRLEARLLDLLGTRTGKLGDVLEVERELARVRGEIERYEGRLRYLRNRTAISRLTIAVHQPLPITVDNPGEHPIRDAFVKAWRNFVAFLAWGIAALGVLIPLGVVLALLGLAVRRIVRHRFNVARP